MSLPSFVFVVLAHPLLPRNFEHVLPHNKVLLVSGDDISYLYSLSGGFLECFSIILQIVASAAILFYLQHQSRLVIFIFPDQSHIFFSSLLDGSLYRCCHEEGIASTSYLINTSGH